MRTQHPQASKQALGNNHSKVPVPETKFTTAALTTLLLLGWGNGAYADPPKFEDTLKLESSVKLVPITKLTDTSGNAIPAGLKLRFSKFDPDTGNYTLFSGENPCSAWWGDMFGGCPAEVKAEANKTFLVSQDKLAHKVTVSRWTTGLLVVPYKYGLPNHSLTSGSVTLGPYAGYSVDWLGSTWTFPFSAGITKVSIPTLGANGAATSTEKAGISLSTGVMFNPGGLIQTGILLGVDQLGSNSGYKDNGKLWLGVYVGAGFGD
jgi:hypothetical protein